MLDEYNVNIANEVFTSLHTHHDNQEIKRSAYSILKLLLEEGINYFCFINKDYLVFYTFIS